MISKTNAIRILESNNIAHEVILYDFIEEEIDAVSVAKKIGLPPDEIFKTLIARANDNEILVFVIPGNFELDLKKAAASAGKKRIDLIHVKEIELLTGYVRGGCLPVGMKKQYRTFIDLPAYLRYVNRQAGETAQLYDKISISAGKRGMQLIVSPFDLQTVISASFADLT